MSRFGTPSDADLERLRSAELTYDHVGSTMTDTTPTSARRIEATTQLGQGSAAFAAGRRALRSWAPQRSLGMTVFPEGVAPDLGETVVLGLGIGPARLVVPNRVVAVVDEPNRYSYAYGTLPGHPERGEELFLVERTDNDDVVLTIRADSVPAGVFRLARPVVETLQQAALNRYLQAVVDATKPRGRD